MVFQPPDPKLPPRPPLTPTRADPSAITAGLRSSQGFTSVISGATALSRKGKTAKRTLIGGA